LIKKKNTTTSMKVFASGEAIKITNFDKDTGTVTLDSTPTQPTKGYLIYEPIKYLRPTSSTVGVFGAAYDVGAGVEKIKVKTSEEKENIILTVGRLGTEAKNTELLLETLKEIDLKDWKVYLVGSIDKSFISYKENFFKENPSLIDKIIFTGEIKDRKELYKYYNRAKVFVLPSRWESFGIVMVEAMAFGNYVITSNTCAAKDITNNSEIGKIVKIDSKEELKKELERVISREINLKEKYEKTLNYVSNFRYSNLVEKLSKRIYK